MRVLRPIAVLFASLFAVSARAQTHKTARPEQVTRAVGVYEWTGPIGKPAASRLVPVTIFLDGHLQDASVFLARPVPLALQTGVIYSIEHAGEHLGTVDLDSARNVGIRAPASEEATVSGWFGYGRFTPPAAEPKPKPVSTASTPSAIVSTVGDSGDDPRPHYTVRQPAAPAADAQKAPDAKSTPRPAVDDEDDRPTLRRRDPDEDKKKKSRKESGSGVIGPKTSLNDDPDRPTMRRGAPESAQFTPALAGLPKDLQQAVAVSDAKARETHDFARSWKSPAEHDETLATLQKLARARVEAYLKTNALRPGTAADAASPSSTPADEPARPVLRRGIPVQPHAPVAAKHRSGTAAPALTLMHEDLHGYTLSYGGLPTFVYTAQAPVAGSGTVYVTLVTQRLPTGELQVSLAAVTDAQHLDRSPWMRLVDAVDVDAGNRASLLFELRAQTGRQFALYRLVTAQAEQSFLGSVLP